MLSTVYPLTIIDRLGTTVLSDTALRALAMDATDLSDAGDWSFAERALSLACLAAARLVDGTETGRDMRRVRTLAGNIAGLAALVDGEESSPFII